VSQKAAAALHLAKGRRDRRPEFSDEFIER
jgi:hypothetical protein